MARTSVKQKIYIAVNGLNFDAMNPPLRVEPEQELPANIDQGDIEALLAIGAIKEKEEEK